MRRRGSGGGRKRGSGGRAKPRNLRLDVASAINNCSTVNELVNHLRMADPHYSRHKLQPFTKIVEKIVVDLSRKHSAMDEPDNDGNTPVTKRQRMIDEEEEKSRLVEAQHSGVSNHHGGASSSVTSACSSEVGDDSLSYVEASTSVEKSEPDFDLLKSILRENLSQKSKKSGEKQTQREKSIKKLESREVKQVMDMEMVNNEDVKDEMVHMMNGEDRERNRNGSEKIRKVMFSDFGGMDGVIKELIQKVIVPFHHPELPCNLRVKPITCWEKSDPTFIP